MKRLTRDHKIYVLDPANPPAITIDSGEELVVETWDAFEGIRDPKALDEKQLKGPGHWTHLCQRRGTRRRAANRLY